MRKLNLNETIQDIVEWLRDYSNNAGIETLVVGVSGGIDSSVVSTLCVMTGIKTILVELPIGNTHLETANNHIKYLKDKFGEDRIRHEVVNLSYVFESMKNTLINQTNQYLDSHDFKLVLANMSSRLRMTTLYSFSNSYRGLVVGTGNKVEDFGIGFFTTGGDGTVDISPIADLMKSEVYEIGRILGLNEEILNNRPTDGLWEDGRTDEDQIGATYDELEWAMEFVKDNWFWETGMENGGFLDYDFDTNKSKVFKEEVGLSDRHKKVLKIYLDRHNKNKHKMVSVPIYRVNRGI